MVETSTAAGGVPGSLLSSTQLFRGSGGAARFQGPLLQDGVLSQHRTPEQHAGTSAEAQGTCGTVRLAPVPWTPAHRG